MEQKSYAYGGAYLKAKKSSFDFVSCENKHEKCESAKTKIADDLGQPPTAYQRIMAVVTILLSFVLCFAETTNCQQSLQGMGFGETASLIMGIAAAALGILSGHEMAAGLNKKEINGFTGKRIIFTSRFTFGLILCLVYLGFQTFLILNASTANGMQDSIIFYILYSIFICLLEVLVGAKLRSAIQILSYMYLNLRQWHLFRQMKKFAQSTELWWQRLLYDVSQSDTPTQVPEETPHIRRARSFYNSFGEDYSTTINA